ncbi:MAG: hypothetical protein HQ478_12940 [Chloroflexi bacterium]|nr:hypothetical protein [Chloroflexota bacterium]
MSDSEHMSPLFGEHRCVIEVANMIPLWHSDEIQAAIVELATGIDEELKHHSRVAVVPLMTGAMMFTADVCSALEVLSPGKWEINPIISSAYGNSFEVGDVELVVAAGLQERLDRCSAIIIFDDLSDTGASLSAVRKFLGGFTDYPIKLGVLVNKTQARRRDVQIDFQCFNYDGGDWLVGYGMDLKGAFRGARCIGAVSSEM